MDMIDKKIVLSTRIFDVEEVSFKTDQTTSKRMYRIACADWANVLGLTIDKKAILIRQPRPGSMKYVLETPGGMIDANEKDATMAAARELEEETGFTSQRILPLGTFNPNPALMTNRIHYFLALGCHLNPYRTHFPDAEEQIQTELVDAATLNSLVRTGQIDHALSALCITLASKYIDIGG